MKKTYRTIEQIYTNPQGAHERFLCAGKKIRDERGGYPKATLENGVIVFTYPNGMRTSGGREIK